MPKIPHKGTSVSSSQNNDGFWIRLISKHPLAPLVFLWLVLSVIGSALVWSHFPDRGISKDGVWLLQAMDQRQDFYDQWLDKGQRPSDPEQIRKAFNPHGALPPLMPALCSWVSHLDRHRHSRWHAVRLVQSILFGALVFLMAWMGFQMAGSVGSLFASMGTLLMPKLFGLATLPGFALNAVFWFSWAAWLIWRARRSLFSAFLSIPVWVLAIHSSILSIFLIFPWLIAHFSKVRSIHCRDPWMGHRSLPIKFIPIFPLAVALAFALYPYLWVDFKDHLNIWLTHFLRKDPPSFLYWHRLYGHERFPIWGGLHLLTLTIPPTFAMLMIFGWKGGKRYAHWQSKPWLAWLKYLPWSPQRMPISSHALPQNYEDTRVWIGTMLVFTLVLPTVMRSPFWGTLDLIALAMPWALLFAAHGAARLHQVLVDAQKLIPWKAFWIVPITQSFFSILLIIPPMVDLFQVHPFEESYYSWFIGGTEGARRHGISRNPRGPLPITLLHSVARDFPSTLTVATLLGKDHYSEVLHFMKREGLMPESLKVVPSPHQADVVLLPLDETQPHFAQTTRSFFQISARFPGKLWSISRDHVLLWAAFYGDFESDYTSDSSSVSSQSSRLSTKVFVPDLSP